MTTKYLKPKSHYIDRYDRVTVNRCRRYESAVTPDLVKKHSRDKPDDKKLKRLGKVFNELHLYFIKGEMYKKKEGVVSEWMRKDEDRDRFCETVRAPENIMCLTCNREMFVSYNHLDTRLDEPDRMLYMYDCTLGHLPRRAFYNTGEEWEREKPKCSKCSAVVEETEGNTEKVFKTTLTCPSCGNIEVREIERTANKEKKVDLDFEKDRARFCNEKEGIKYVDWMRNAEEFTKILDKQKERKRTRNCTIR